MGDGVEGTGWVEGSLAAKEKEGIKIKSSVEIRIKIQSRYPITFSPNCLAKVFELNIEMSDV